MITRRTSSATLLLAVSLTLVAGLTAPPTLAATTPSLHLSRTIRTTPFQNGSSVSMHDAEGSAYVARDDSLWLADDNGRAIYEVNPRTGDLKRVIEGSTFESAPKLGGGSAAGSNRNGDLESMAYDEANDVLYVFSGPCCTSSELPTAFRLMRDQAGRFQVESYQPLSGGADYTGSAWSPLDHKVYIGVGSDIRSYDYASNASGAAVHVSGLSGILGMGFSADGADLWVVTSSVEVTRVDWKTKTAVSGWSFGLSSYGMKDTRAVEQIGNQLFVLDGYDGRSASDPLRYAVFVFDMIGLAPPTQPPTQPPTASFTADRTSGTRPLKVTFTDTSTGRPTSWAWRFGDGATSTKQNPTHTFRGIGSFTVTLTATNAGGSTSATGRVDVSRAPAGPTASFTASRGGTPGTRPLTVFFTDTSAGRPTDWWWTFGDTATSSSRNPSHAYRLPGTYHVTLRVSNANGHDSRTKQITVRTESPTPPPSSGANNLVRNHGFEAGTWGWSNSGESAVSLTRVSDGHSGRWAAALTNSSSGTTCKLNDHDNWITTTRAGTYIGSFWVRADAPGAEIKVRFVEYRSSTNVGERAVTARLTRAWQRVSLHYTPVSPGDSSLDFQAYVSDASAGTCFYADDASITLT